MAGVTVVEEVTGGACGAVGVGGTMTFGTIIIAKRTNRIGHIPIKTQLILILIG